nr:hypothetical protein [Sphingomonas sp. Y57]
MAFRSNDIRPFAVLVLLALSGCAATTSAPPAPVPLPAPPPAPAQAPTAGDWRDWPLTPGTWRYLPGRPVSAARYGDGQTAHLVVQCDASKRQVMIMRLGSSTQIEILASTRSARFPAGHVMDRGVAMSAVILSANDGFLDVMAFSRGRIGIRSPGLPDLAVPAWAEPARAIEDCQN